MIELLILLFVLSYVLYLATAQEVKSLIDFKGYYAWLRAKVASVFASKE